MTPAEIEAMFRMVAIGDYDDRYVIPKRHGEVSPEAFAEQGSCGIDFANAGADAGLSSGYFADGETATTADEALAADFDLRDSLIQRGGEAGRDA